MPTFITVEVPTVDGPVRASVGDDLVWYCNADGIRRMLQSLVPPSELVESGPERPSYVGEVVEIAQNIVPGLIIVQVAEDPDKWDPEATY